MLHPSLDPEYSDLTLSRHSFEQVRKTLKSDLKSTTTFVKRVSVFSEDSHSPLLLDIRERLNLSRFVDEIVTAIAKAPLKVADCKAAAEFCSAMHAYYDDFLKPLLGELLAQFELACKTDERTDVVRRRVLLCWFAELYWKRLMEAQGFVKAVRMVTKTEDEAVPLPNSACLNIDAVCAVMAKTEVGKRLGDKAEVFPPPQVAERITGAFTTFAKSALIRLDRERTAYRSLHRKVEFEALKRGEAPQELVEAEERRARTCEELFNGMVRLCPLLAMEPPLAWSVDDPSPEDEDEKGDEKQGLELYRSRKGAEAELSLEAWVFGDEATRSFYEDLEDLAAIVPRMILERPDAGLQPRALRVLSGEVNEIAVAGESVESAESIANDDTNVDDETLLSEALPEPDEELEQREEFNVESAVASLSLTDGMKPLDELMSRLPNMLSDRLVDSFARDFAHLNSRAARKRLVEELFLVPWGRSDLLSFYARLAATLSFTFTGIGKPLSDSIRKAFFRSTRDHRPGSRMGSRMRYARYLGELVKFGLKFSDTLGCPPAAAFRGLRQSMEFFQGENIDMICAMVESCGRELFRCPRTHDIMEPLLESLQRNRTARVLNPTHDALVDNAYYHCKPPQDGNGLFKRVKRRERSELESYVRFLLLERLGALDDAKPTEFFAEQQLTRQTDDAITSLFRLPWHDSYQDCSEAISRTFLAACKQRAGALSAVSTAIATVSKKYPNLGVTVLDDLLEQITLGVERNDYRHNQRRVGQARALGFLVKQRLISPIVFFDTLFMILHRGHERPTPGPPSGALNGLVTHIPYCGCVNAPLYHPAVPCASDPTDEAFRVRLVCGSLETAADALMSSAANVNLVKTILKYVERFIWSRSYFPIDVEFCLLDTIRVLETKSHEAAKKIVDDWDRRNKRGLSQRAKKKQAELLAQSEFKWSGRLESRELAELQVNEMEFKVLGGSSALFTALASVIEEDEEDDDEEEDDEDEANSEEFASNVPSVVSTPVPLIVEPPKPVKYEPTEADLDFEADFSKMMRDTMDQTRKVNFGAAALSGDNLVVPLNIAKKVMESVSTQNAATTEYGTVIPNQITLQLMKRSRGGKAELKPLVVPRDSMLAMTIDSEAERELQERKEQKEMKKLTLKAVEQSRE